MSTFDEKLLLVETVEITNFTVTPFTGKYKCISGDKHIVITNTTVVTDLKDLKDCCMKKYSTSLISMC